MKKIHPALMGATASSGFGMLLSPSKLTIIGFGFFAVALFINFAIIVWRKN